MGKLRRERTKYHLKKASENQQVSTENKQPNTTLLSPPAYSIPENVFAGIDIKLDKLQQSLQESDAISVKTNKSGIKEKHIPKTEKRRLRHEAFLKKLETAYQMKKKIAERKRRQKDTITGDLNATVNNVEAFVQHKSKEISKKKMKNRSIPKAKHRQKKMMQDISAFRKMLADPEYKVNPLRVTTDLLEKKVNNESES